MKRNRALIFFVIFLWLVLPVSALAMTINFEWDRNTETDMSHYVMYRCPSGSDCSATSGRTAVGSIPHPASGEKVTWSYTFTPPPNTEETQYFACTAVDQTGNESGPSNIVNTRVDNKPPANPTGPLKILGVMP